MPTTQPRSLESARRLLTATLDTVCSLVSSSPELIDLEYPAKWREQHGHTYPKRPAQIAVVENQPAIVSFLLEKEIEQATGLLENNRLAVQVATQ